MYLRAYKVTDPQFLDSELSNIKDIGEKLKYPRNILEKCHAVARTKYFNVLPKLPTERQSTLVLPFNEKFLDILSPLKKLGINVAFSYNNTVKNQLLRNRPKGVSGCVYKIPCKSCSQVYVGMTGKSLECRVKQHMYSVRSGQENNALFNHKSLFDHHIDWKNASKIISNSSFIERTVIESCIISETFDNNLNLSYGHFKCDPIIKRLVCAHISPGIS